MTGQTVYEALLQALRKDKRGLVLSLDEFNSLSVTVDKRVLIAFMSRFEDDIEITSHAGFLKVIDYPIYLTAGVGLLPSNYFRAMGDPYYLALSEENDPSPNPVFIDVVTSMEYTYRQRDYLTQASLDYPLCVIGSQDSSKNMQIRVTPKSISTIFLNYVRVTQSPFLHYYVNDTTLQVTYLDQGAQNVPIPTGCTYRDGTKPSTVNSLTKDFEWDLHELPWILAYFMQAIGVALPDDLLVQVGKLDSAEIQNKPVW
jgi:hypothetical protein